MSAAVELEASYEELYSDVFHSLLEDHLDCLNSKLSKRHRRDFWKVVHILKGDIQAPAYIAIGGLSVSTKQYSERLLSSILRASLDGGQIDGSLLKARIFLDAIIRQTEVIKNGSK